MSHLGQSPEDHVSNYSNMIIYACIMYFFNEFTARDVDFVSLNCLGIEPVTIEVQERAVM